MPGTVPVHDEIDERAEQAVAKMLEGSTADVRVRAFLAATLAEQIRTCRRLEALEAAPVQFRGVWQEGREYPQRSLVSHGGGLWFAHAKTIARPGDGCPDWQLCVKGR